MGGTTSSKCAAMASTIPGATTTTVCEKPAPAAVVQRVVEHDLARRTERFESLRASVTGAEARRQHDDLESHGCEHPTEWGAWVNRSEAGSVSGGGAAGVGPREGGSMSTMPRLGRLREEEAPVRAVPSQRSGCRPGSSPGSRPWPRRSEPVPRPTTTTG